MKLTCFGDFCHAAYLCVFAIAASWLAKFNLFSVSFGSNAVETVELLMYTKLRMFLEFHFIKIIQIVSF